MFQEARFAFAVNIAIAKLGVSPTVFHSEYRRQAIELGRAEGQTAHEVAAFLVYHLPTARQPLGMDLTMKAWAKEGKVSRKFLAGLGL